MNSEKFSYDFIDHQTAERVNNLTVQIKNIFHASDNPYGRVSARNAVAIGEAIEEVKARLPTGYFLPWIASEVPFGEDTAENYLRAAKIFKGCIHIDNFAPTALYLLSKTSVPKHIRFRAIELAEQGEKITKQMANALIAGREILGQPGYASILRRQKHRYKSTDQKQIKSEYQVKQEILLSLRKKGITPKTEEYCGVGIADIVTHSEIYELKRHLTRDLLFKAIGQILIYRQAIDPSLKPIIIGCSSTGDNIVDIMEYANQMGVEIRIWD